MSLASQEMQPTFDEQCKALCPRCASGDPLRFRDDTKEFIHDWSFGGTDPKTGKLLGRGQGICLANDLRKQNGQP